MSDVEKHSIDEPHASEPYQRPPGLKGLYYHPYFQCSMLGFVCFMGPGLFNALNGLGGGGQVDATTSANGNVALYSTFALMAFFAGSVNNKLGSRLTLLLGATGYSLYIGAYLALNIHPHAGAFLIAAGAVLGVCAGLLWSAQGSLMMAYPTEQEKGRFVAIFWSIFNLGGVVGAAVSLGQNFNSKSNSVSNGTYIGFLILTLIGVSIPMLMADPHKMYRTDGTKVSAALRKHPKWSTEFYSLWVALRTDPYILLLFPLFFASNWFYTWQFNDYNGALFNIRTRALNSFIYWTSQIFGSIFMGYILDIHRFNRRTRAFLGWGVLVAMVLIVHIWGYEYQKNYTRESVSVTEDPNKIDWSDHGFAGKIWLYIFCGFLDSMWQTAAYWMMGAMSNDPEKLAHFAGFYKSIQSAGAAGSWRADAVGLPYMNIFASTWALLLGGLVCVLPMLHWRVKDTTSLADETLVRMDDSGKIHAVEEFAPVEKA